MKQTLKSDIRSQKQKTEYLSETYIYTLLPKKKNTHDSIEKWLYESLTHMSCEFQIVNVQNRHTEGERALSIVQHVVELTSLLFFFILWHNSPY